jgi:hypothetical protein
MKGKGWLNHAEEGILPIPLEKVKRVVRQLWPHQRSRLDVSPLDLWPKPQASQISSDPRYLFIFTPPYSGSTALAKILNSTPGSMILNGRAEGQWLIPGLCTNDRWDPWKYIDWESVKLVWSSRVALVEEMVAPVELVIEKSPPNLVRSNALLECFPKHEVLVFNRNPYGYCSSILYRQHQPEAKTLAQRAEILELMAHEWVYRSS